MMNRQLRQLVIGPLACLALVASGTAAAAIEHAPRIQLGFGWIFSDGNVQSAGPELNPVIRKPPDLPQIRFDMEARVVAKPKKWRATVTLEKWHSAKELGKAKGKWLDYGKSQEWTMTALPAVGQPAEYLSPDFRWDCTEGAYVAYVEITAISGQGQIDHDAAYFPWKDWDPKDLREGDVYARPTVRAAFHPNCAKGGGRIHG